MNKLMKCHFIFPSVYYVYSKIENLADKHTVENPTGILVKQDILNWETDSFKTRILL